MPSQLYDNDAISFVCARNFTYNGHDYEIGADFPQEDLLDSPEVLVRARYLIPVVEEGSQAPRHWYRHVRTKEQVLAKLGRTGESLLNKESRIAAPDDRDGDSPLGEDTEGGDVPQNTPEEEPAIPSEVPAPEETTEQPAEPEPEEETSNGDVENEIKEFDPMNYTVPEVKEYLDQDDISIDEFNRVIELEMDGKGRAGILNEYSVITNEGDGDE